jgi:hypothetical protein
LNPLRPLDCIEGIGQPLSYYAGELRRRGTRRAGDPYAVRPMPTDIARYSIELSSEAAVLDAGALSPAVKYQGCFPFRRVLPLIIARH